MKDAPLKDRIFRHFWARRFFAQPEVEIFDADSAGGAESMITDVDVYALRPTDRLTFGRTLADAKTLAKLSAVNRAFWLSGLMRFVGADEGFIVLRDGKEAKQVLPDHHRAARRMGILLLNEQEFDTYDKSIVYPEGTSKTLVGAADLQPLRELPKRFPPLLPLTTYVYREGWSEPDFGSRIRHSLHALRSVAGELDPAKAEHAALVADAAAMFAVGLAECVGLVFQEYLHPDDRNVFSDNLKVLIWGGRENYRWYRELRVEMLRTKGVPEERQDDLALPQWPGFLQLVRLALEQPARAFEVPWILRNHAISLATGKDLGLLLGPDDAVPLRVATMALRYVIRASAIPRDFEAPIQERLIVRQSEIASIVAASGKLSEVPALAGAQLALGIASGGDPKAQ